MRKFITLLSFLSLLTIESPAQNTLTIHQKDGQQFSYGFSDKPVITYTESYLVLTTSKNVVEFPLSALSKFTFSDIENAVIAVKDNSSKPSLNLDEYTVSISDAEPDQPVSLLSIDGKILSTYKTGADGSVKFSIAELTTGTYIIKSESLTCKILKK